MAVRPREEPPEVDGLHHCAEADGAEPASKVTCLASFLVVTPRPRGAFRVRALSIDLPSSRRGRRECRALAAPMARLQQETQAAVTTGSAETSRHSPRNGFTAYFVLSPGTGFLAPVISVTRKASSPTWPQHREARTTRLDRAHRAVRRHGQPRCSQMRPPHPALNVRDGRETSLMRGGTRGVNHDFCKNERRIFLKIDLEKANRLGRLVNLVFRRT
jgi:hypothetical protein